MTDSSFESHFESRGITWHHIEQDAGRLKALLKRHRFSSASFDTAEHEVSHAEFDDFEAFYAVRVLSLTWSCEEDRTSVEPLYVWADDKTVISFTPRNVPVIAKVRRKLADNPEWIGSTARVVYFLVDEVLGSLFLFLDSLNDQIAALEQEVFHPRRESRIQSKIFRVKRETLRSRRILASMRDMTAQLVRHWTTTSRVQGDSFYYMELYDHMIRLFDTVDTCRELINSVLDLYLSTVSNRLNEIVKTLTLLTTVLLPASLVAALYGMNFDHLPMSHHPQGFFVVVGIIAVTSGVLFWIFRRRQWL